MGRVDAIHVHGVELWFNSHDHLPPHFHAARLGEWEVRVYFLFTTAGNLNYQMKWGRQPSARYLRQLEKAVLDHRATLLEEWERKVCL